MKHQLFSCLWVIATLFLLFFGKDILFFSKPVVAEIFPGGLRVTYFEGTNFNRKVCTRTERKVEHGYAKGSPAWGVPNDNFSALWDGFLRVPADDMYHFKIQSDDGSRLFINNELIIDHWGEHDFIPKAGSIQLNEGKYPIRIEYFNRNGNGKIRLRWYAEKDLIVSGSILSTPYLSKR